jgi:hypothetical protein
VMCDFDALISLKDRQQNSLRGGVAEEAMPNLKRTNSWL